MDNIPKFYTTNGAISSRGQHAVSRWLDNKILHCQTSLVSDLLSADTVRWEQIENRYDDSMDAVEEFLTFTTAITDDERDAIWQLPFDEREGKAIELGWDPEPKDIYEWWLVTPGFAEHLRRFDEPIFADYNCHWWGRCCTGQWLGMDETIVQLAKDAEIIT